MQNKAFLIDTRFLSPYTCPSIDEGREIVGCKHAGYVKGDILLDIIKEGLIEKRRAIYSYRQHHLVLQYPEFVHEKSNEGNWNFGRALCRQLDKKIERFSNGTEQNESFTEAMRLI